MKRCPDLPNKWQHFHWNSCTPAPVRLPVYFRPRSKLSLRWANKRVPSQYTSIVRRSILHFWNIAPSMRLTIYWNRFRIKWAVNSKMHLKWHTMRKIWPKDTTSCSDWPLPSAVCRNGKSPKLHKWLLRTNWNRPATGIRCNSVNWPHRMALLWPLPIGCPNCAAHETYWICHRYANYACCADDPFCSYKYFSVHLQIQTESESPDSHWSS